MDSRHCRAFTAGNRAIAVEALQILKKAGQKGVLAIIDADTDHLTHTKSTDPDLLITHTRDAEGMIFQSAALQTVLVEFDLDGIFGANPEYVVLKAVAPIAYTKFIADSKQWTVKTSQLDFSQFVDAKTLKCDSQKLCQHMADLTLTAGVTAKHYELELNALTAVGHEISKVARGHDATELLAWAIPIVGVGKKRIGILKTSYSLESYLRTAYPIETFTKSDLYSRIEEWERKNAPYKVLVK